MIQSPDEDAVAPDVLKANIETTDYTAIVRILKGRVQEKTSLRRPKGGYVNHIYQARVLETIKGPRYERITFSVMADSDIKPYLPGYPVIVSLCGNAEDRLYVPDNGYELPANTALTSAARSFARKLKASPPQKSVCSD